MSASKLSDAQLVLLSSAAQHPQGAIELALKGAAATKVVGKLHPRHHEGDGWQQHSARGFFAGVGEKDAAGTVLGAALLTRAGRAQVSLDRRLTISSC